MSDFWSAAPSAFFKPEAFLGAWERTLGFTNGFAASNQAERTAVLQRLRARTRPLWERFNTRRDELGKHYMDETHFLEGYLSSFFLPNIERTQCVLSRPEVAAALSRKIRERVEAGNPSLVLCDFGSGPLSATFGFIAALTEILEASFPQLDAFELKVFAVDRATRAIEVGRSLLDAGCGRGLRVSVQALPSVEKVPEPIDVFLGVNVLNEIPEKHRLSTVRKSLERCAPEGIICFLEPGQEVHSRSLVRLRDAVLAAEAGNLGVVAPCLHAGRCPLSGERSDWCWFRRRWKRPRMLEALDAFSGLEHDELTFSYVVWQKGHVPSENAAFARVVSDGISIGSLQAPQGQRFLAWARRNAAPESAPWPEKWKSGSDVHLGKVLLCTRQGTLEAAVCAGKPTQQRGMVVFESDLKVRCVEGNQEKRQREPGEDDPESRA